MADENVKQSVITFMFTSRRWQARPPLFIPSQLTSLALPDVVWQCRAKHGTALRREATAVTARDQRT